MPYTVAGKHIMLRQFARASSHLSLHSDVPVASNELERGIYERKKIDFGDPVNECIRLSGETRFDVPAGAEVTHAGCWTDTEGGVLLGWGAVERKSFEARGVYVIDSGMFDLNLESKL